MRYPICILLFLSIAALCGSCKKEENTSGCQKPDFSVSTGSNNNTSYSAFIYINGGGVAGFFEIEYGANGFTKGTGITQTISGSTGLSGLAAGTYDFYARGNCGGTDWSEWAGPKSFLVQQGTSSCATPTNLTAGSGLWLNWDHSPYGDAEKFELEYGVTGFTPGSGTLVTINGYFGTYSDGVFSKGTTYDYYVRANCGNNEWSAWTTPHTFYASVNRNRCLPPTQVNAYTVTNFFGDCVGIEFQWDDNGESAWELSLVGRGSSPGSGNIDQLESTGLTYLVACGYSYDFYIRAVCTNGSKTAWFGPKEYN